MVNYWPSQFGKRLLDLSLTILVLTLFSPLFALIALLVCLTLGSPVLVRQKRPGLHGQPFTLFKIRTMTDACDTEDNLQSDERRLTPFGQFLRATSLVAPRPLLMHYMEGYTPEQMRRHEVKPGISGWAQVNGRNALTWEEKFEHDIWYVDHPSLWLDIKILVLTIWKIPRGEGINQPGQATMEEFSGSSKS